MAAEVSERACVSVRARMCVCVCVCECACVCALLTLLCHSATAVQQCDSGMKYIILLASLHFPHAATQQR